ncbi:MAG: signal peptidase I [Acidimicrobiia bacterium]
MRKRGVVAGVVGATILASAAVTASLRRFRIVDDSMEPALSDGDFVIARRRAGALQRGIVVVTAHPEGQPISLVKRVIGLQGERIGIDGGRVTVNGALLADRWANGSSRPNGEWDVPEDHVWLLSDNRGATVADGRTFGPTPISDIDWVVASRYYPASRAGRIA